VPALVGEPGAQPARERLEHGAHGGDLVTGRGQEVHVLRQRAAQGAGHGLGAAVVHQASADLRLDRRAEPGHLGLVVLELQPALQPRRVARIGFLGQPGHQPIRIDGPHGAEQVVGAGHRPARLDPGVPVHEQARDGPQHDLVAVAEGGQQQFGQGGVVQGAEAAAIPGAVTVLAVQPGRAAGRRLAGLGVPGVLRRVSLRGLRSEVEVEDRVEGELVITGLHQDRPQGGLHRAAVGEREVAQGLHRVDPFRDRDRDADLAQFGDHAFYGGEHDDPAFLGVNGTVAATAAAATDTATMITRLTM